MVQEKSHNKFFKPNHFADPIKNQSKL